MKRRGFLQLLGGALTAPVLPSASLGAGSAYPASALHAAIYHAQTRVTVSAFGLAHVLGLKSTQAQALMADLSARGVIGPVQGAARGGWAASNVLVRQAGDAVAAQRLAQGRRPAAVSAPGRDAAPAIWPQPDIRPLLRHLYDLCRAQGRALHPRCAAQI